MLVLGAGQAAASPDGNQSASGVTNPALTALITNDDLFSVMDLTTLLDPPGPNGTQHYGPYASGSPDSGTCGNWADDLYDQHFTVRPDGVGTFTVVAQYKRGSFTTRAGPSPGSCDTTDGSPPGTVDGGVIGDMHGYLIITVTGTQTSTDPSCIAGSPNAQCTTTGFIISHFTGSASTGTFFFHYSAGDQGLVEHEWKNASADRGGNHGDIRSANL